MTYLLRPTHFIVKKKKKGKSRVKLFRQSSLIIYITKYSTEKVIVVLPQLSNFSAISWREQVNFQ
jgi:hypothetical protein